MPPVLAMPNDVDTLILDADSSDHTIGAVLSQVQGGVEWVRRKHMRICYNIRQK